MKKIIALFAILAMVAGVAIAAPKVKAEKKIATVVFTTDLDCHHCAQKVLNTIPYEKGIKDVQVAGIPSKRYGEAVGAFIILHEGVEMTDMDVREFCDGKIARYKIPKYIFFVKEFPMTGSGKIQKFKLKDLGVELCAKNGIEII